MKRIEFHSWGSGSFGLRLSRQERSYLGKWTAASLAALTLPLVLVAPKLDSDSLNAALAESPALEMIRSEYLGVEDARYLAGSHSFFGTSPERARITFKAKGKLANGQGVNVRCRAVVDGSRNPENIFLPTDPNAQNFQTSLGPVLAECQTR